MGFFPSSLHRQPHVCYHLQAAWGNVSTPEIQPSCVSAFVKTISSCHTRQAPLQASSQERKGSDLRIFSNFLVTNLTKIPLGASIVRTLVFVFIVAGAHSAQGQALLWEERGFLNINLLGQVQSQDFSHVSTFDIYDQTGTAESKQTIGPDMLVDVMGGARVWKNMAVGASFSSLWQSDDVVVNAHVPHPLYFDSTRTAVATTSALRHTERSTSFFAAWVIPTEGQLDVSVFAGPSFVTVNQAIPNNISANDISEIDETFSSVTLQSVGSTTLSKTAFGFIVGADVTYMFSERWGAGSTIRYNRASADLSASDGRTISVGLGGLQIGGGLRVRF